MGFHDRHRHGAGEGAVAHADSEHGEEGGRDAGRKQHGRQGNGVPQRRGCEHQARWQPLAHRPPCQPPQAVSERHQRYRPGRLLRRAAQGGN